MVLHQATTQEMQKHIKNNMTLAKIAMTLKPSVKPTVKPIKQRQYRAQNAKYNNHSCKNCLKMFINSTLCAVLRRV